MIKDSKAELLETRGLYRRAAVRWAEVMYLSTDNLIREKARRRRDKCLEKAKRPPATETSLSGLQKAARETQQLMGIARPNGEAFRLPVSRKKTGPKKGS
ncbi:PerC family transcriptional regulator (plasmid) [Klebsiella sp. WOUb02]|uniref:PerC family transcriptional regulator n=1 Tax=Klebsiella sp. WOUb02 TaxID=3161071 RepID=UPI003CF7BC7D